MGEKLLLSSRQLIQIKLVPVPKSFPAKSHDWNNRAICQKRQIENYRRNPENIFDLNINITWLVINHWAWFYFDRSKNNCIWNVRAGLQLDLIYNTLDPTYGHGVHKKTNWQNIARGKSNTTFLYLFVLKKGRTWMIQTWIINVWTH